MWIKTRGVMTTLACLAVNVIGTEAWASQGPIQGGPQGHYYQLVVVPGGISWDAAAAAAANAGGYLATITSAEENAFVTALAASVPAAWFVDAVGNSQGPWLGGFQAEGSAEPGGGWQWVNGEGAFQYTRWAPGEPSNGAGNDHGTESRLQLFGLGPQPGGLWNDERAGAYADVRGYVIESPVPEPGTWALWLGGIAGLLLRAHRPTRPSAGR